MSSNYYIIFFLLKLYNAFNVSEYISETKVESNILEERDPEYDAMLKKMAGTIRSKPGGKLEMGEVSK